ncbi:MAG: acyloxyacyl hydrolase [Lutibacter sp.]|uniref:acyloxyacyl hydrolase n=1 Tax=Lutibacter sp. TaxID=1925666 RepID=UPI00299E1E1B|nr:acyloxyacyl hydrolase [Lutibacter sp.]MDX1828375.1 acyloxyacyl hydrolase [Lutibacter sp.]
MRTFLAILYVIPFIVFSQTNKKLEPRILNNFKIQIGYQNGYVFATNDFIKGINGENNRINAFQAFTLKFSKQTTGINKWEQLFKYPSYGVGIYLADFHNPEEIGTPIALYGFFNAPFKRWSKLTFNYELGFGATFNWKSFNPITNQYNIAIGAGQSFFIDAGLNLEYRLNKKMDIAAGFSFTHFSNGALKKPNKGINNLGPKISFKYNLKDRPFFIKNNLSSYIGEKEWLISAFGGIKNVIFDNANIDIIEKYEGLNFPVFGVSTVFNKQVSYKSKFGIGMSFSYNGTLDAQVAIENNQLEPVESAFSNKIQISIFPSYELIINKVSLIVQPAFYLFRKKIKNKTPVFYQKIGIKYHFSNNLFAGITLRDYSFHVSDFIEWNIGYRIKWREK